jgi:hypothetical protein
MGGATLRRAAAARKFVDDAIEIADSRKTNGDAPNEKGEPPIEFAAYDFDFTRNATSGQEPPTPVAVTPRERSSATSPRGEPANEIFACRFVGSAVHVLPASSLHSQSYDAGRARASATRCTVPAVEPCVTANGYDAE